MPSVYNELCLACSGSAVSGSQRQCRSANDKHRNRNGSSRSLRSGLPPERDAKTRSGVSSRTESAKGDLGDASVNVVEYEEVKVFRTSCCARPICAACLQANPRLARYVPCLACLGGVRAVTGSSSSSSSEAAFSSSLRTRNVDGSCKVGTMARREEEDVNLNGALRDGDVFVLGGEDEDEDEDEDEQVEDGRLSPPPPYADSGSVTPNGKVAKSFQDPNTEPNPTPDLGKALQKMEDPIPGRHYIQKNDTLRGLALKYGVDGRTLCRLNKLPTTTLSTTPHLLHTRTVLDLPPSAKLPIPQMDDPRKRHVEGYDREREREIELERTAKRLQLVAKEADWEVARAYAVLTQTSSSSSSSSSSSGARSQPPEIRRYDSGGEKSGFGGEKEKEKEVARQGMTPRDRAVDAYLEDNAWEARERAAGRGPGLRRAR